MKEEKKPGEGGEKEEGEKDRKQFNFSEFQKGSATRKKEGHWFI